MFKYFYQILFILTGVIILLIGTILLGKVPIISPLINVMGGMIAVIPASLIFYRNYRRKKEMEEQFLVFLRDLKDSMNSGMSLPIALDYASKKDYGALTPQVNNLASQVDWGIPFKKALETFANDTEAPIIKRAVSTIIQTYTVGGKIADTLSAVGDSLVTISNIRKERASSIHAQMLTSYLIFFVFIFILIVLQVFLVPALTPRGEIPGVTGLPTPSQAGGSTELYTATFINFIIIQGFFAGLVTGKMAEGSLAAGIKHSILLIAIGYTLFSFATQTQLVMF